MKKKPAKPIKPQKKKRTSRRSKDQFPALNPALNLRSRYELIDYDYVDKLSDKDKEWLNKFTDEYINDNLDRDNLKNNLHNTEALKKDCDDRNNARNRCVLNRSKAAGDTLYLEEIKEKDKKIKDYLGEALEEESSDLDNSGDDSN